MKIKKDERINAKSITFWETVALFIAMMAFSGFHMWIYAEVNERWPDSGEHTLIYISTMGGYVLAVAALMTLLIMFFRRYSLGIPMQKISEAARQVAQGDFSVRVPPQRRDGKKDYIELMYEDFNKMAEELGSIEALKDDFISNVSHEIKTPLSVIQNYTKALEDDSLPPEKRREYQATIVAATDKLSDLVTNILKLNKLNNQEIVMKTAPYDLGEQLRKCALGFEEMWEKKGIDFSADIEDDITVNCDEGMFDIVWNNLLSNAIKFTEAGGTVSLCLKKRDGYAVVSVTDSGCGMDAATCAHVFDKFYQGDTSHSQEGNGLGLAMVKRVIDLSKAEITVDSKPGAGTTFSVQVRAEL